MVWYEYDEEASAAAHMDVVHEVDDSPVSRAQWVAAMRALNAIEDPLVRKLVALHRNCGSGEGVGDSDEDVWSVDGSEGVWGCETLEVIANHFHIARPDAKRATSARHVQID